MMEIFTQMMLKMSIRSVMKLLMQRKILTILLQTQKNQLKIMEMKGKRMMKTRIRPPVKKIRQRKRRMLILGRKKKLKKTWSYLSLLMNLPSIIL